jgi:hypothetical protein
MWLLCPAGLVSISSFSPYLVRLYDFLKEVLCGSTLRSDTLDHSMEAAQPDLRRAKSQKPSGWVTEERHLVITDTSDR